MNNFDLIMFDLDGTLIETAPEICDAVNDTLRRFDLPDVSQQQVNDWIGHGTRELLIQALAFSSMTRVEVVRASETFPLIAAEFDIHYQARCGTRSHLYPQVRETLTALRAQGVKLAVVTNKEGRFTQTVLNVHTLSPLLDSVVSGDTLPTKKPNPAGIAHCLAQFGVPAHRALFVGDSSIDVATARNAGVAVWTLPYGYNMGQPIESCAPDRVIADCSELLN
jgi:phosphoglycolate phosphatase